MVYKTPASCFPVITYCVKMRKVESINFRFGGRSTTFCSSANEISMFQFIDTQSFESDLALIKAKFIYFFSIHNKLTLKETEIH